MKKWNEVKIVSLNFCFLTYINKREDEDANNDLFMKFYEKLNKEKEPGLKVIRTANQNNVCKMNTILYL